MTTPSEADALARSVQAAVVAKMMRNRPVNSFSPAHEPGSHITADGRLYLNDIAYGTKLPNSFLDIWHPDAQLDVRRPVLVYFHGGGFLFGDKVLGDPLAAESSTGLMSLIGPFMDDGFAVVCSEYAFAPEHLFPAQVLQVDQVVRFIQSHADQYALDSNRIVLMGGSAGASLTEIYGLVVANPAYAQRVGVRPGMHLNQLRGVIVDEAALATAGLTDGNMRALMQTWLGEKDIENSEAAKRIAVAENVDGAYPPAFINASNVEPWFEQSAVELRDALKRHSLPHEFFYRDRSVEPLEHGYVNRHRTNAVAKDCFDQMRAFALRVVATA